MISNYDWNDWTSCQRKRLKCTSTYIISEGQAPALYLQNQGVRPTHWISRGITYMYWLVVWNIFYFSIYWECHHPNWFFRGVGQPPTSIYIYNHVYIYTFYHEPVVVDWPRVTTLGCEITVSDWSSSCWFNSQRSSQPSFSVLSMAIPGDIPPKYGQQYGTNVPPF